MNTGSGLRAPTSFLIRLLLIPVLLVAATAHAAAAPAPSAPTASETAVENDGTAAQ